MAYRRPWYVGCQWEVQADTSVRSREWPSGVDFASRRAEMDARRQDEARGPVSPWQPIYCARTKGQARKDGSAWTERTGQRTRIVPGPGHKTRRGA